MEDRASQALACRVGCSEFCRALGRGPFSIIVQNITTWNRGTVKTVAQEPTVEPARANTTTGGHSNETSLYKAAAFSKASTSPSTAMEGASENDNCILPPY